MAWGFKGRRFGAIVGSRETPEDALLMLEDIGEAMCDSGVAVTSGDADGADFRGVLGAMRSPSWSLVGARVFLPWGFMKYPQTNRTRQADGHIYFDASKFENYEEAQAIAFKARGSFEGLGRGGISMHTRNAYQVLLDDLKTPVAAVFCWAKPVGKLGKVSGGTNTAVQIALSHQVPVINLATDEGLERAMKFLQRKGKRP